MEIRLGALIFYVYFGLVAFSVFCGLCRGPVGNKHIHKLDLLSSILPGECLRFFWMFCFFPPCCFFRLDLTVLFSLVGF